MQYLLALLCLVGQPPAAKLFPPPEKSLPAMVALLVPPLPAPALTCWITYPPLRDVSSQGLGVVLADIESHMPAGHQYRDSDPTTWAHETTHGINSNLRVRASGARGGLIGRLLGGGSRFSREVDPGSGAVNGFYCLNNMALVIAEPPISLLGVSAIVPSSLRGMTWNLYMQQQAGQWNSQPLYILDEWTAYLNGTAVTVERQTDRPSDALQSAEFCGYAWCMVWLAASRGYYDDNLKSAVGWLTTRTVELSANTPWAVAHLQKMRTAQDVEALREFMRGYCTAAWTKRVLGF